MTVCEDIGAWAAGLSVGDVPERALDRARLQTASILAGARAESGRRRRSRPWRRTGRWARSMRGRRPRSPTTGTTTCSWATPATPPCGWPAPSRTTPTGRACGPGGGQRGGRPVGRGAVPRTSQRAVLVLDPLRVGGGGGRGRPGPRRRAARARPGHRPLPATVRTVAGFHGAGLQAADRRRAGRPGRAGGAAGGPGRHRGARRDRGPPGPPGQLLLRAAPGDAGRAGGGVADRHAGLQAAAGLRLPPGRRRSGARAGDRRRRGDAR